MVKPQHALAWPIAEQGFPRRGGAGTVVPADDPLINCRATDGMPMNQMHHLMQAPPDAKITPHQNPRAAKLYEQLGYTKVPYQRNVAVTPPKQDKRKPVPAADDSRVNLSDLDLEVPKPVAPVTAAADEPAPSGPLPPIV